MEFGNLRYFWRHLACDIQGGHFEPRCSHTCVQVGRYFYIIAGGVYDPGINDFKHYRDVWKFDPVICTMKRVDLVNGSVLKAVRGHSASVYEDSIYLFGGLFHSSDMIASGIPWDVQQFSNKFYRIDTNKNEIVELPCNITGRRGHTATIYNDKLFIIGGELSLFTPEEKHLIHIYDLRSQEWSTHPSRGKLPQHLNLVINDRIDDTLYFYVDEPKLNMNDLTIVDLAIEVYALNLNTLEWRSLTQYHISDDRFCAGGKFSHDNIMVIFGGTSTMIRNKYLNDVLVLRNKDTLQPTELVSPTTAPLSRNGMSFTPIGKSFLMIGGGEYKKQYYSDIWILDLMYQHSPLPCVRHSCLDYYENLLENKLFVDLNVVVVEKSQVQEATFQAHRIVLASRCTYFGKMLSGKFSESRNWESVCTTIKLNDVKISAFQVIFYFIYTGRIELQHQLQGIDHIDCVNHIIDCLELASMLNFTEFVERMENIILVTFMNPLTILVSNRQVGNVEGAREAVKLLLELLIIAHNNDLPTLLQSVYQHVHYFTLLWHSESSTPSESPLYSFIDFDELQCHLSDEILEKLQLLMTYKQASNLFLFEY